MPDPYVMNDWISQSLVLFFLGMAFMYGVGVLFTRKKKR